MKMRFPNGVSQYHDGFGRMHMQDSDGCMEVENNDDLITAMKNVGFTVVEAPVVEVEAEEAAAQKPDAKPTKVLTAEEQKAADLATAQNAVDEAQAAVDAADDDSKPAAEEALAAAQAALAALQQ